MTSNLFIGIDGGATKISAGFVRKQDDQTFMLEADAAASEVRYAPSFSGTFEPVPLETQLNESEIGEIKLSIDEERQGIAYAETCEAVLEILKQTNSLENIPIGIGMPGIKTKGRRGISVMNNGPRMPRFADVLNKRLTMAGLNAPNINTVGDDNYHCGLGECVSDNGNLKNVTNALYIGGGTGIADALILDGVPVHLDSIKNSFQKTWEIKTSDGQSVESLISQNGLMHQKAKALGSSVDQLEKDRIFPENFLKDDAELAGLLAKNLSWLIYYRILSFSQNFHKNVFEKIVLGQRLGSMLDADESLKEMVNDAVMKSIKKSEQLPKEIKDHYLTADFLFFSTLTEAPIIGAAASASSQ